MISNIILIILTMILLSLILLGILDKRYEMKTHYTEIPQIKLNIFENEG